MKVTVVLGVLCALGQTGFAKCIPRPTEDSSIAPASSDYSVAPVSSDYSVAPESSSEYSAAPDSSSDYEADTTDESDEATEPASSEDEAVPSESSDDAVSSAPSATDAATYSSDDVAATSDTEASSSDAAETPDTGASGGFQLTASQLDGAVPAGMGAGACTDSSDTNCANNARALVSLNKAAAKYGVTARGEVVAMIALMAFESESWHYNINISANQAGQGTKAMLMYPFIYKYAKSLYPDAVEDAWESATDAETMNKVRAMVLNDDDSFGSAFWYLTSQQPAFHNTGKIKDGDVDSFKEYCVSGVQAGWTDNRAKLWETVNKALSA
ncbi:hypothetical protein IWW50_000264 [Coemansia erecta]|nr:hypothetical protein IWW50_000264 [Coemansia erecta]